MSAFVPSGMVYAFEPYPPNFRVVSERARTRSNILAFNFALAGSESGARRFHLGKASRGDVLALPMGLFRERIV